ncbi:MAG: hypothetical protein Q4F39_05040 [Bacteroidia bacterium]|nr:hypothetical protein [Bacteroidia bacterium]
MKKIFTFMVIALCAMAVVSCKNSNNNEAAAEEVATEECCANCAEGECDGNCSESECANCDSTACAAAAAADEVAAE